MIRHKIKRPPQFVYPADPWRMVERAFYPKLLAQTETAFSIGNGYLGMRGNFEEGRPVHQSGTFINGFHETWPIVYGETAFGFAKTGQTIINVPDGRILKLYVDDEPLFLPTANLLTFERTLDMRNGLLERDLVWETPAGKVVHVKSQRLVSFEHRHVAAICYEVTVVNAKAPVLISSQLVNNGTLPIGNGDPRGARAFAESPLAPQLQHHSDRRLILSYQARRSGMTLACGIDHEIETDCPISYQTGTDGEFGEVVFTVDAEPGKPIRIFKYLSYHSSRGAPARELMDRTERSLDRTARQGFADLLEGQRRFLDDFWYRSDVVVEEDPQLFDEPAGAFQQAIRWNLFQILQATARAEGVGVPSKGLTGQAYDGQYFWDTEVYLLPFLIYTEPRIARNLLRFRHSMLNIARERARELNSRGALFPWRTISGEEASAYYAAGTAQFHINADIMYALQKYVNATGDREFLFTLGVEMLVETARMWVDMGFFNERKNGRFCIHSVTGPDEYTTVVDNNTFTNLMARENLRYAAQTVRTLKVEDAALYERLVHATRLEEREADAWQRAADNMYVPYDEEAGIHPQDEDFLEHQVWDFAKTPPDKYPLLLHHHPLVIYRHQVIKQADIVLAMLLLGNEFSDEQKRRNFEYYDPLTTGDSSLSACIQSIVATEIGRYDKALEYGRYAVLMDLADVGENVSEGCHIASMGGTWMVFTYGIAGMRDYGGKLTFRPRLPRMIKKLSFPVRLRSRELVVTMDRDAGQVTYQMRKGTDLTIWHNGQEIDLTEGKPAVQELTVVDAQAQMSRCCTKTYTVSQSAPPEVGVRPTLTD
jgi:alpha,alpha-trehalose phosphorylase